MASLIFNTPKSSHPPMKRSHFPAAIAMLLTTCLSQAAGILTDTTPVYDENVNQTNTIQKWYTNTPAGNTFAGYTNFTNNITTAYNANLGGVVDDWVPQLSSRIDGDGVAHQIKNQTWGTSLGSNGFSSYTNPTDTVNTPTAGIFVSFDDSITNPLYVNQGFNKDWNVLDSSQLGGGGLYSTSDRFGNLTSGVGGYFLELGTDSIGGALEFTDYYPTISPGYGLTSLGFTVLNYSYSNDTTATAYFSNGSSFSSNFSTLDANGSSIYNVFWGVEAPTGTTITHFNIHGMDSFSDPLNPNPARIYLDDIALVVTPVPESSTSALVILAGLSLATRRRRVA
jgi:hypothetical protein